LKAIVSFLRIYTKSSKIKNNLRIAEFWDFVHSPELEIIENNASESIPVRVRVRGGRPTLLDPL
jgi:hypothetical protein